MESVKTVTLEKGSAKVELQKILNSFNEGPGTAKGFDPQDLGFRDAEIILTTDEDYLEERKITHCGLSSSDRAKLKGAVLRKRGIIWGYKGIVSNYCFRLPPSEAYFRCYIFSFLLVSHSIHFCFEKSSQTNHTPDHFDIQ